MTDDKLAQCLMILKEYIADDKIMFVREKLKDADDSVMQTIMMKKFHNPTQILLFSIFLGGLGVDRFILGDTGVGIAKLLLGWLTCGIWPLIDIFVCYKKAKEVNFSNLMLAL